MNNIIKKNKWYAKMKRIVKLPIPRNTKEQFGNIWGENLGLLYNSAKLHEYEE